jgi:hypothetical protein
VDWIEKQDITICDLKEIYLTDKDKYRFKVKGRKRELKQMKPERKQEWYIHISDKADCKTKLVKRDKEEFLTEENILTKGTIH